MDIREMDDLPWRYILQAEVASNAEASAANPVKVPQGGAPEQ